LQIRIRSTSRSDAIATAELLNNDTQYFQPSMMFANVFDPDAADAQAVAMPTAFIRSLPRHLQPEVESRESKVRRSTDEDEQISCLSALPESDWCQVSLQAVDTRYPRRRQRMFDRTPPMILHAAQPIAEFPQSCLYWDLQNDQL
jgi:hypothetical protein